MKRLVIAALLLGASTAFAGDVLNPGANSIGGWPDIDAPVALGPALQGSLMLEDGTSFLLLEDASSHLCFEGGC